MWIEATSKPLRVQFRHAEVRLQPGRPIELSETDGRKLLAQAAGKVRLVGVPPIPLLDPRPAPPLQAGWLVAYRSDTYVLFHGQFVQPLCGGADDRAHGTVQACTWNGTGWIVILTDGQRLPLSLIRSVGKTDETGLIVSAWTVRDHGADGEDHAS